jgi:hypothetical protein
MQYDAHPCRRARNVLRPMRIVRVQEQMKFRAIGVMMTKEFERLLESVLHHPSSGRMRHLVWCHVSECHEILATNLTYSSSGRSRAILQRKLQVTLRILINFHRSRR